MQTEDGAKGVYTEPMGGVKGVYTEPMGGTNGVYTEPMGGAHFNGDGAQPRKAFTQLTLPN